MNIFIKTIILLLSASIINLAQFNISGSTVPSNVEIDTNGVTVTSDGGTGNFIFQVPSGWSGTISAVKAGYSFSPTSIEVPSVNQDTTIQTFTGTLNTYTISGNTGTSGVTIDWTGGVGTTSLANGNYSFTVNYGYTGTITPTKTGYTFSPSTISLTNVTADQTNKDFTPTINIYTISGNTGTGTVLLSWFDGTAKTFTSAANGDYTITVNHGFTGTITPTKAGYSFTPASRSYASTPVITNLTAQDFTESLNTYTVSGNAGTSGVTIDWTGGVGTTSLANGNYSFTVNYGYTGTITPTKAGYTFSPSTISLNNISADQPNKDFTPNINTYTVSGNAGTSGVTIDWTGGVGTTSLANGNYSFTVNYGYTGTITPTKAGYTFSPSTISLTNVTADQTNKDFTPTINIYTISGNTGTGTVLLSWFDGTAKTFTSAANGAYTIAVNHGFTGTITPIKVGYTFTPASRSYASTPVITNLTAQDFTESLNTYTISGNAGTSGVTINWTGGAGTTSLANGNYSFTVNYGYTGTITPAKTGYTFSPSTISLNNITADQPNKDFTPNINTYTVSGNAGTSGVTINWTGGAGTTSLANGNYSFTVNYGYTGTITPAKTGYTFSPSTLSLSNIIADQPNKDFTPNINTYTISGNTGTSGVTINWTGGVGTTSLANGNYSFTVNYGYTGTITPAKTGYTFSPSTISLTNVTADQPNKDFTPNINSYTISGNTETSGVTINWTGGAGTTSLANGNYSFTVNYGYTGTITPTKTGYTFSPSTISLTNVTADQPNKDFTPIITTYTISGNAGTSGVTIDWTGGVGTTSLANGNYSFTVNYGYTGTITPTKTGYTFSPSTISLNNITADQPNKDFTPNINTYTVSGNAGTSGVTINWTGGVGTTSLANGNYSFTVNYGYTGTITPTKTGYTFSPSTISLNNIIADQPNKDFTPNINTYTVSGNAGTSGVTINWTGGVGTTSLANGNYSFTVNYGYTGTITPTKTGYTFSPSTISLNNIIADQPNKDFTPNINTYTVSGNAGTSGVTINWTGGVGTTSLANGNYSFTVNYGYTGTITPTKTGYTFSPSTISLTNVTDDQPNKDFTPIINTYTISGNTGTGAVLLSWFDGTAKTFTSAANGAYTIAVNHGFTGTITPTKAGYSFTPANRSYASTPVITNLTAQDFTELLNTYTISGNTGTGAVLLSWFDGTAKTFTSAANGAYTIAVNHGFTGTITPTKAGYSFTPANRSYASTPVITNLTAQDFTELLNTYTISGNTGTGAVLLSWFDGTAKTFTSAANGAYTIAVNHGFTGTITPTKAGYSFTPANRSYASTPVITNLTAQDFTELLNTYTISGNTGTGAVLLSWFDGTAKTFTSAANGLYTITVNHGFTGTITPTKVGYTFTPTFKSYDNLSASIANDNYIAVLNTYLLSTAILPLNSGTVTGGGVYNYGTIATIEAIPAIGYSFVSWSGDLIATDNPENIVIDGNKNITANFKLNSYIITTSSIPTIGGTSSGGGTFNHGAPITLIARSATGYKFVDWKLNGLPVSTDSTYTFSAANAGLYTANFTLKRYNVSVTPIPIEGGTLTGAGSYQHGSMVNLIATPKVGWRFLNWKEGNQIYSVDSSYSFVVLSPRIFTGNFAKKIYNLATSSVPAEAGSTVGDGNYEHGTNVTIIANPNVGWKFLNWKENNIIVFTDSLTTFPILKSRNLVANYIKKVYAISATSSPLIGGVIKGDSSYTHGDQVTLTATANIDSGYEFVNWTENSTVVSTSSVFKFVATKARSLVANFRLKTYSVNLTSNPLNAGQLNGVGTYTHGDLVTISAIPEAGWLFANWTENVIIISDKPTHTFRIKNNHNIAANFANVLYSISGSPFPIQAGFVSGTGSAFYGQNVTLTAAPNIGWDFKHWKEGDAIISTNPAYLFTVTGNRTLTAEFELTNYSITCAADPSQGGITTGCGLAHYGQNMSVNAIANNGYKFMNWTENSIIVSTSSNYSFIVERNRELVAHFDFSTDLEKLDNSDIIPDHYYLSNAFPNPFNPETNIQFGLPEPSEITLAIFDVRGQMVANLLDKVSLQSGNYNKKFTAINFTSGIYFYRILANAISSSNNFVKVGKLVLVK